MSHLDKRKIDKINTATVARYNRRLSEKGAGSYALGWGKEKYQLKRFYDLLHVLEPGDLNGKAVLDIGCGLGDLYKFIKARGYKVKKYIGTDINDKFINIAKERYPECIFRVTDLIAHPPRKPLADIGIALGVINFKQKDHDEYTRKFILSSFAAVKDVLVVNMISDVNNADYPREKFINYFNPSKILALGQKITPFCSIVQDYAAEPQYEFMLIMRKHPWKNIK